MANDAEIILNLWYVYDERGWIYSLRARCYVHSGTEEEKLSFLSQLAETDYAVAKVFPVPERFSTTFVGDEETRKMPVIGIDSAEAIGGIDRLFEDAFRALDAELTVTTRLSIGPDPLVCITPLLADENDDLHPQTHTQGKLG